MDRCHTNQCLKSYEITSYLNQLPLISDCMTFSNSSALQADEVNFLYSTLCSCSTTWRGSKVWNQKEIFFTVLIHWRKGYLIAREVASSQSINLIIPRAPHAFVSRGPTEFCFRLCHRNALTEKAWEGAVQRLSKARHTTGLTGSKYH